MAGEAVLLALSSPPPPPHLNVSLSPVPAAPISPLECCSLLFYKQNTTYLRARFHDRLKEKVLFSYFRYLLGMEFWGTFGTARMRRRFKQHRGQGRRVSKFARGGPLDDHLEPATYEGVKSWEQLFPMVQDRDVDMQNLLQTYRASLSQKDGRQKKAALECQSTIWDMVERNRWCEGELLFFEQALIMAKDKNWNFLMQQLVLLSNNRQLEAICGKLSGHVSELAVDVCGCRLLCRICEHGKRVQGALELLMELSNNLSEYALDRYGNFVVIKILKNFVDFPGMDAALLECIARWD